jgi:plasmid stabilization system protein ParE
MNLRILASARNDLADGRDFYERQGEGLGGYFLDSLFSDIDSLMLYAGIHRKVFGFHRLLSKRFPYGIYYQFNGQDVIVYRVLDLRQNPRKIRTALKSGG